MTDKNQANDNMTIMDLAIHQNLKNDICPKKASVLLRTYYLSGWDEKEKDVADLIFSLFCSRTLIELIETIDSDFKKTVPYQERKTG